MQRRERYRDVRKGIKKVVMKQSKNKDVKGKK
jgi:hypothetical protein